eukprot:13546628-Alexandrium_andersonii.AAC.1
MGRSKFPNGCGFKHGPSECYGTAGSNQNQNRTGGPGGGGGNRGGGRGANGNAQQRADTPTTCR